MRLNTERRRLNFYGPSQKVQHFVMKQESLEIYYFCKYHISCTFNNATEFENVAVEKLLVHDLWGQTEL